MIKLACFVVMAFVTQYGWTGYHMANGVYPYVGAVACPRKYPLGTEVLIQGKKYTCSDRTAIQYDDRFDIYSTGTVKSMLQWGKRKLPVIILGK